MSFDFQSKQDDSQIASLPLGSNMPVSDESPALLRILKHLRPFQREAYEFATQGVISTRQLSTDDNTVQKNEKHRKTGAPMVYDPKLQGNGRLLLADEMGLGKSVTSLAIMTHYVDEWPLLILCPASLRYTWPGEIEKFLPHLPPSSVYVVQGFDDADFYENEKKRKRIKIVVATYSLLQMRSAAARVLQDFKFQCVIADESHNLKQKSSQRTQLALPLLQNAKRLILLSGTPALARPVELWTQVYALAPKLFGGYTAYTKQYCNARRGRFGWDVNGLSNADELHSKLKQVMVRRLKADVLDELPPKQRSMVPINIPKSKQKECGDLVKKLCDTRSSIADLVGDEAYGANFEARQLLMQAYQCSGVAKVEGVCDYLLEWIRGSDTQKVLIFGHHKAVLDAIENAVAKELKGVGHIRIDGMVNSQERAIRVKKFQTSSSIRVAVLSLTAAGVGLTLTAATTVMFAELHWTPGVLAQAEDRCHRIGQRNAVNVMYLVCEDSDLSVDMQLWQMLGRKINNLSRVVDGDLDASFHADKSLNDSNSSRGKKSGEEELQHFFSETPSKQEKSTEMRTPVKGSIMSFFAKQSTASKASNPNPEVIEIDQSSRGTSDDTLAWNCKVCTFRNSFSQDTSEPLRCEVCCSSRDQKITINVTSSQSHTGDQTRRVTPRSTEKKSPNVRSAQMDLEGPSALKRKRSSGNSDDIETIILDDADDAKSISSECSRNACPILSRKKMIKPSIPCGKFDRPREEQNDALLFSVSRNSGRVTIHYAGSGQSSLTNFDIDQILTKETADKLTEAKMSRKIGSETGVDLIFNDSAIHRLLDYVDRGQIERDLDDAFMAEELKKFVCNYVALFEIEKRILQESGTPYSWRNLKQSVLRHAPESTPDSTNRYVGGAKERARERMENGVANVHDMAVLQGRKCAYCGKDLSRASLMKDVQSTYCSRECANDGRLKRGGMYSSSQIRAQVFALEGGICRLCGINAHALYNRIAALQPAERLNALCNANWKLPRSGKALERLLQEPKEGDFWNADHIKAVAEGGGGCNLNNLRTLCVPCHAGETEKLQHRLRLAGGRNPKNEGCSNTQIDIRTLFNKSTPGSCGTMI